MIKITAIYEHGVIRPLKKVPLRDRQKVELRLENQKSPVNLSKAIIHVHQKIGKFIAQSPHLSPLGG